MLVRTAGAELTPDRDADRDRIVAFGERQMSSYPARRGLEEAADHPYTQRAPM